MTTTTVASVIRWEEPPATESRVSTTRRKAPSKYDLLANELRSRPGQWALVLDDGSSGKASGLATHIRLGQVLCFTPTGDFDAVTRVVDGKYLVYARYVGEEDW